MLSIMKVRAWRSFILEINRYHKAKNGMKAMHAGTASEAVPRQTDATIKFRYAFFFRDNSRK
jgi:hypothetical protein